MTDEIASGFLSYARSDDERENGRITRLATKIMEEFETLTGSKIDIFVDRSSIEWGDAMRSKLDEALQQTTFFIPVLTPTYFLRDECRREMVNFANSARALGLEELLMSIRYVPIPDLREDSADELKALASGMQYADWTSLRLQDEDRAPYLQAVNSLAQRLVNLTHTLETKEPSQPVRVRDGAPSTELDQVDDDEEDDAPGLIDLLAEFEPRSTAWLKTLNDLSPAMKAFTGPFAKATEDMNQQPGTATFAYRINRSRELAREVELPLEHYESLSKEYSSKLLELDPVIRAFLEMATLMGTVDWPEDGNPFASLLQLAAVSQDTVEQTERAIEQARGLAKTSRDLRPVLRRFEVASRNIVDAQSIIQGWATEIETLGLAPSESAAKPRLLLE